MGLVSCKECSHKVSRSAKFCPHCGVERPGRNFFIELMFVIFALVIGLQLFKELMFGR